MRGGGVELVGLGRQRCVELGHAVLIAAAHHPAHGPVAQRGAHAVERARVGDDDLGVGVVDEVAEVVVLVQVTDRDRYRADPHRSEERDRECRGVVEDEQHSLLAAHAQRSQQMAGAVDLPAQLLVGEGGVGGDERRRIAPAGGHLTRHDVTDVARLVHVPHLLSSRERAAYAARSSIGSRSPSSCAKYSVARSPQRS